MSDDYHPWRQSYSNEDMDRIQALANRLTTDDRHAGRLAPPVGFSPERYADAQRIVREAQY
jgi:hypothetical protein